ncbi:MAG: ABC transporter substrate-binding protein [Emcibacteraceae bacterium]|nr:ABC transporter substrate-binding protein [Emcibacteraceae bacterium]
MLINFGGSVEEILMMKPDVVIATDWAFMLIPTLNHYGIETNVPEYGHKAETFFKNLTHFGEILDRTTQADLIINNYKARLKTLNERPHSPLKVAYITPSGYTGGTGTFIDDIIKLAGYASLAEDNNIAGWQQISLEQFLLNPPDLIVSSFFNQNDVHVSHWSLTRHPKIKKMMHEIPTISIPGELISCGGLFSIETAEFIRREGEKALKQREQLK